jgi:hypothetical protein
MLLRRSLQTCFEVIALLIIFLNERMAREGYLLNKELDMQRRSTNSFLSFIMHGESDEQAPIEVLAPMEVLAHDSAGCPINLTDACQPVALSPCPFPPSLPAEIRNPLNGKCSQRTGPESSEHRAAPWVGTYDVSAWILASPPPVLQASGATISC